MVRLSHRVRPIVVVVFCSPVRPFVRPVVVVRPLSVRPVVRITCILCAFMFPPQI